MSIINKMHQDLRADESPILASMPTKKGHQKGLFFILISLLLASSIGLSYLIYSKEENIETVAEITQADVLVAVYNDAPHAATTEANIVTTPIPVVVITPVVEKKIVPIVKMRTLPSPIPTTIAALRPTTPKPVIKTVTIKPLNNPPNTLKKTIEAEPVTELKESGHLEIKKSILSNAQRAGIHLKRAEIARKKGDLTLVATEKNRALAIRPELHDTRKSLALYYYGIGELNQATNILKKGALAYPEYADFNLMLSRIALKNGEQQKAYLYLNQHPPKVKGHLDYHVSYAILAQKFKKYGQSEGLYQGLLTERPNNGRWLMSLAIAQDKQGKERLAIKNYQKALLQIDLSSNAKKYINQRLTYLATQ